MTRRHDADRLDRVLDRRARPESEIERIAIRALAAPRETMPAELRARSWEQVLAHTPTRAPVISQAAGRPRHIGNRRRGLLHAHLPLPGVVCLGLVLSLVVAFGGRIDDPGGTPSVSASTTASPASWAPVATPVPTPVPSEVSFDV
jgi:hypothetical protein